MTLKEVLIEFCEGNELSYSEDYSGRYMYGRTCFSITCNTPMSALVQLCDYIRDYGFSNAYDVLGSSRQDSMGMSSVLYFPYAELNATAEEGQYGFTD